MNPLDLTPYVQSQYLLAREVPFGRTSPGGSRLLILVDLTGPIVLVVCDDQRGHKEEMKWHGLIRVCGTFS